MIDIRRLPNFREDITHELSKLVTYSPLNMSFKLLSKLDRRELRGVNITNIFQDL